MRRKGVMTPQFSANIHKLGSSHQKVVTARVEVLEAAAAEEVVAAHCGKSCTKLAAGC